MSLVDLLKKFAITGVFVGTSLVPNMSLAKTVTLSWDPSPSNISGYKVHYDTSSNVPLNGNGADEGVSPINVGNALTYIMHGLPDNEKHYFAVTAYDSSNNESSYSNIVFSPEVNGSDSGVSTEIPPVISSFNFSSNSSDFVTFKMDYSDPDSTSPLSLGVSVNNVPVVDSSIISSGSYSREIPMSYFSSATDTVKITLEDQDNNVTSKFYVSNDFGSDYGDSVDSSTDTTLVNLLDPLLDNFQVFKEQSKNNPLLNVFNDIDGNQIIDIELGEKKSYVQSLTPNEINLAINNTSNYMLCIGIETSEPIRIIPYLQNDSTKTYASYVESIYSQQYSDCIDVSDNFTYVDSNNSDIGNAVFSDIGIIIDKMDKTSPSNLEVKINRFEVIKNGN